jgi:hypothetical protein
MCAWLALAAPPSAPQLNGQQNILAIHVAELTLEPNFQILRRHGRYAWNGLIDLLWENHVPRAPRWPPAKAAAPANASVGARGEVEKIQDRGAHGRGGEFILPQMRIFQKSL